MMTSAAPWWAALLLTLAITVASWRAGSLRRSGLFAATALGVLALRVAWGWGAFLIAWFVLATVLSRVGRARKTMRTGRIVGKGDRRDAWQVLANGGPFAACALLDLLWSPSDPAWSALIAIAAAGSLAAAGADTWATEIGTLLGGEPWSLRSLHRVPAGTSGAVTASGSAGGVLGAFVIASMAAGVHMIPWSSLLVVAIGGVSGAFADTMAGAWLQERRWCARCEEWTERPTHSCGTSTAVRDGAAGVTNDVVNLLCAAVGAITSASAAYALR